MLSILVLVGGAAVDVGDDVASKSNGPHDRFIERPATDNEDFVIYGNSSTGNELA
jgi:hypothetical protein